MLQVESYVNILDNSGTRKGYCIKIYKGYRCRYAKIGDVVKVAIRQLKRKKAEGRTSLKIKVKLKRGDKSKALLVETRNGIKKMGEEFLKFKRNVVILLTEKKKFIGTRVFLPVVEGFRYTRYSRLRFLTPGLIR